MRTLLHLFLFVLLNSIHAHSMERDPRLLLELPNEILRKILQHASKDDIFNALALLVQLSGVCKKLTPVGEPDTMKIILNLNQRILDDNLVLYALYSPTSKRDFTPFFKLLIGMGANMNYCHDLISCVCTTNNTYFIEHYITHYKPNINMQDKQGNTPLRWAIHRNYPNITKLLLEHGADIYLANNQGETPTSIALLYGRAKCLKLLIKHGIDTTIEYDWGHGYKLTIAKWAENAKNEEIYKLVTDEEIPKLWYESGNTCVIS